MDKKITSIVAYITPIGWVIAYLAGDKEGAKLHLNQGLVIAIIQIACSLVSTILGVFSSVPVLGIIVGIINALLGIVGFVAFVFAVIGIVYAVQGQDKALPLIGGIKILK